MTEENIVTFQVAKLAKEKGFNWKVRYSYGHKINPHIAYPKEDYSIPSDFNSPNMGRNWSHLYSAPTQSLLQKWLREVHDIHIYINIDSYKPDKPKFFANVKSLNSRNMGERLLDGFSLFDREEQALEEGLQEALKLIK